MIIFNNNEPQMNLLRYININIEAGTVRFFAITFWAFWSSMLDHEIEIVLIKRL